MKLGYVTASFPYGNGESFLIAEIEALARAGADIWVLPLFPRGDRQSGWQEPRGVQVLSTRLLAMDVCQATVARLGSGPLHTAGSFLPLLRGPLRLAAKNLAVVPKGLWMAKVARDARLDHLHVHWAGTTATAGMLASAASGVPWSMTCHRWDIYEDNFLAHKVASARFTRFISRRGREDAVALGADPARTTLVHLGAAIPTSWSRPGWAGQGAFSILCPANLEPVKGHTYLLQACAALVRHGADVRLLIAGEGPLRDQLEREVDHLGLRPQVSFLGQVPHADLMGMYTAGQVHLVVLPSVDLGGGVHEGVPVSLMESMARGVPVVATRSGSIPELLPDSLGLTVTARDAGGLAALLGSLIRDPARYAAAGDACRLRVQEEWSVDRSAGRLLELMRAGA